MDLDGIGYARELQQERERILARVPAAQRARILGRPAPYAEPKAHKITVDLRTGERTVDAVTPFAPVKPEPRPPVVCRMVVEKPNAPTPPGPSAAAIISAILEATGISLYEYLREGRSNKKISRARQMGYWLTKKKLRPDMSSGEMGRMFRKDHTTILSGVRKGEEFKDTAPISEWLAHPAIAALLER